VHCLSQVRFNILEALSELKRFGLLVEKQQSSSSSSSSSSSCGSSCGSSHQTVPAAAAAVQLTQGLGSVALPVLATGSAQQLQHQPPQTMDVDQLAVADGLHADASQQPLLQQQQQQQRVLYSVLGSTRSVKVLQQYWAGLLEARVGSILQDTGTGDGDRGLLEDSMDHLT
jgi:hypothetical protein